MNNRDELRQQISEAIRTYCEAEHNYVFSASDPIVRLHEPTFSAEEIDAALDCLLTTRVTMGRKVKTFEVAFSASGPFGPGVMVNSSSSANLLTIAAGQPEADALQPGDEVIVPALSGRQRFGPKFNSVLFLSSWISTHNPQHWQTKSKLRSQENARRHDRSCLREPLRPRSDPGHLQSPLDFG